MDTIDLADKDITADALHTQRTFAEYLVAQRRAHYHFTVKANQPILLADLTRFFQDRQAPQFVTHDPSDHGRIETRAIWTTTALNGYLDFPHVGQAFAIERIVIDKKTGKTSSELVYGITSRPPTQADAQRLLKLNRGQWAIESSHYLLDWNYDEDRCRIRTGYGPENVNRLRRFAIGILKSKGVTNVAQTMRKLNWNVHAVFDSLRMSRNACAAHAA